MNTTEQIDGAGVLARTGWRIIPLLGLAYLVAFMDRSNISFAAKTMNADLGFSATIYGIGGGVFFLSYALFEIPSNILLERIGARRWIARIMISWGVIAAGMMWVHTPWQFYTLRFLLGLAEAGFFPGVIFYLSLWFPRAARGRAISRFYISGPLARVVMGLLSPALLAMNGMAGLKGWQWLFVVEGLPAVLVGLLVLWLLPERPETADWLNPAEKAWLSGRLAQEGAGVRHGNPLTALPGNVPINDNINRLLAEGRQFVVAYVDLDYFKPFNDTYGYARGDQLLLHVAEILRESISPRTDFVGHLGGDDFVIILRSTDWLQRLHQLVSEFARSVGSFYSVEHRRAGGIQTADRFGELRRFGFLTLSIAILDTGAESYTSAAQMAERLQVVKSRAKAVPGNCLLYATPDGVRDLLSDAALPGVDGLMAANL